MWGEGVLSGDQAAGGRGPGLDGPRWTQAKVKWADPASAQGREEKAASPGKLTRP